MNKFFKIDRNLKTDIFVETPTIIHVNKFNDSALKEFRDSFDKCINSGQEIVPISIDSPGGHVYALLGMLDIINTSPIPVATFSSSKAMSCGSVLLSAGTPGYRYASPQSYVLIHQVSSGTWGKVTDMEIDTDHGVELNELLMGILDKNSGHEKGYFENLLKENGNGDLYLKARQAKKHGLIDKVGSCSLEIEVTQKIKLCVK